MRLLTLLFSSAQAEAFLRDMLLAVATDKNGLNDVLTGRTHGLEPPFEGARTLCTFQHYVRAMELRAIEDEGEEAVIWVFCDLDDHTDVLRAREGKPRHDAQRHRSFWSR